jgi:hypothetical protein
MLLHHSWVIQNYQFGLNIWSRCLLFWTLHLLKLVFTIQNQLYAVYFDIKWLFKMKLLILSEVKQRLWDLKFSQQLVWCSELSSGIYCHVKWLSTDVSEVRTASIIRDERLFVDSCMQGLFSSFLPYPFISFSSTVMCWKNIFCCCCYSGKFDVRRTIWDPKNVQTYL